MKILYSITTFTIELNAVIKLIFKSILLSIRQRLIGKSNEF